MPIHGYPGNIITANPTTPSQTSASGVWTTEQQLQAINAGNWPPPYYLISRSLRFNSADSAYLRKTFSATSTNFDIQTLSFWFKRSQLTNTSDSVINNTLFSQFGSGGNYPTYELGFEPSADTLVFMNRSAATTYNYRLVTTQVFRDPSAWYHLVIAYDSTLATSTDRIKMWINGVQITSFSSATYPSSNLDSQFANNTYSQPSDIGAFAGSSRFFSGYLTEINFIDGQALTPSSFGETDPNTGIWRPIKYTGTYGTNGFYLNFSDNSNTTAATLGKDYSGNGNNWTPNGFSVTAGAGNDSLVDTPTSYGTDTGVGGEVRGNYCTLNPIDPGSVAAPTNGNLDQTLSGTNGTGASGSMVLTTGKWYWEVSATATTNAAEYVGVIRGALPSTAGPTTNPSGFYYGASGNNREDGTTVTYGNTWSVLGTTYVIGVALDCDANTAVFYLNGVSQGTRTLPSTTSGWKPQTGFNSSSGSATMIHNFGQRPFAYTAPSGFKALCTQNLPTPTIGATSTTQANKYMDVSLYTGTGAARSVTNAGGFQPDFVWIKTRGSVQNNSLFDAVRGTNQYLWSNLTTAETSSANGLTAFNSNGFSVGANSDVNENNISIVGWQWNAGGSNATNTSGTITSTVRANTTAGFSIVTYTGTGANATVGHGLGAAAKMLIIKGRNVTDGWYVLHANIPISDYQTLNNGNANATAATVWNGSYPTSTVFSVGTSGAANGNGTTYVAYCFADVAGYSAFGSYTGNGSTDGPFIYTGFRPRYIMSKRTDVGSSNWQVYDTARDPYNVAQLELYPNTSGAEATSSNAKDILSNGFKLRTTDSWQNASGGTYIYAAFAESPFKYALAR